MSNDSMIIVYWPKIKNDFFLCRCFQMFLIKMTPQLISRFWWKISCVSFKNNEEKFRHQLITLMTPDEVESEINLLSKKYFRYSSKEVSYLRDVLKQHVNNLIRRKRPSGAYSFLLLHKKIINYSNLLSYNNL